MIGSVLVTGAGGGIGRYIHEELGGAGFTRRSGNLDELKKRSFDVIVHCAWNYMPTRLVTNENFMNYYQDNTLLTQELLQIPHNYFVFFSTVDIYPGGEEPHFEDEVIYADSLRSIHGVTKMISEAAVRDKACKFLILRPTSLVGRYMRKNNLLKLFEDSHPSLSLDASSIYNVIGYSDVLGFIRSVLSAGKTGIFNLASTHNITLEEITRIVDKDVVFGPNHYEVGNIPNDKAVQIFPVFNRTSEDVLQEFLSQILKYKTA